MITETYQDLDWQTEDEELEEDMASLEHGAIGTRLLIRLGAYALEKRLGEVFESQTTFKFKGKKPNRQPDVSFVVASRLPNNWRQETEIAPDLAVEVVSKNDKDFLIEAKVKQYQKSGVRLVWVIRPYSQTLAIYRLAKGLLPEVIGAESELSGEDVIPGFKLKVSELFAGIPVNNDDELDED